MSSINNSNGNPARKSILVISIAHHLHGVPIEVGIKKDWSKEKGLAIADSFENIGFDLDPEDPTGTLKDLKQKLERRDWDGIIVGWCIRGNSGLTVSFEDVVRECCGVMRSAPKTKLMFCTGPDNLVETVSRNFPVGDDI